MEKTKKTRIRRAAVETAVSLWGALSLLGVALAEGPDGHFLMFPFFLPSALSLYACSEVFRALMRRGYFASADNHNKTR